MIINEPVRLPAAQLPLPQHRERRETAAPREKNGTPRHSNNNTEPRTNDTTKSEKKQTNKQTNKRAKKQKRRNGRGRKRRRTTKMPEPTTFSFTRPYLMEQMGPDWDQADCAGKKRKASKRNRKTHTHTHRERERERERESPKRKVMHKV